MKRIDMKKISLVISLVIFSLFANQAWAANWILYNTSDEDKMYYDKSSIKEVNKDIIQVWTKKLLTKNGKTKVPSSLKRIDKTFGNTKLWSNKFILLEFDCVNEKYRIASMNIYNEKGSMLLSKPEMNEKWRDIVPKSVNGPLKNVVCQKPEAPKEAFVAPKVEEPVVHEKTVVAAPAVTDKNLAQVNNKHNETKSIIEEDIQNLITKWLTSWKSGDMKTYRSCYASDFQSKGMDLNAWVSHKINVYKKSKNINISIDDLRMSEQGDTVTAVFTQSYSSSILKDKGKKTLELRKINGEWKIYREIVKP